MRRGEARAVGLLVAGVVLAASPALGDAPVDTPIRLDESAGAGTTGSPSLVPSSSSGASVANVSSPRAPSPRSARLLAEGVAVGGFGVAAPFAAWLGFTQSLRSFTGFFAGFGTATLLGAVVAPLAVYVASRLWGGEGGVGRALLGTLVGVVLAVAVGGVLATAPGPLYLVGLGLLWALPAAGTWAGLEWGRGDAPPPGLVVARF